MFFTDRLFGMYAVLGVLSFLLARRRGLGWRDVFAAFAAALLGTGAAVVSAEAVLKFGDEHFGVNLPYLSYDTVYLASSALVLAALRKWQKTSGFFDFLLLLGCLLPLGRVLFFIAFLILLGISGDSL